jgi:hypothetical protein
VNALEQAARRAWLANAADSRFGRCETCERVLDEDGKHLFVVRQAHQRKYECLACFDAGDGSGTRVQGVAR